MIHKVLLLFCLLAATRCQNNSDVTAIIDQIFIETTVSPDQAVTPTFQMNLSCTTQNGKAGECVPYYMCNDTNINRDVDGVIDIAGGKKEVCFSYLDTCCLQADKIEKFITPVDNEPKRKSCGWRNPRGIGLDIIGSDMDGKTKFAEFPWMCAILKTEAISDKELDSHKINYIGGGSLIHPSVILTGAHHKVTAPELRVRAGEWDTQTVKELHPYQDREVASIAVHKDFNKHTLFYDIALLFLTKPIDLAPNVGVACLPPPRERVAAGTRCFLTGWGKDQFAEEGRYQVILNKIELPTIDHFTCQDQLRKTRLSNKFKLHTSFMCAGGKIGTDVCKGDGGSPLSCPIKFEEERYMQSGVLAWSIGCGQDSSPSVYVDVSNLRNWIDEKVAAKGYDPKTYTF